MASPVGQLIDERFEITSLLAEGGFGAVYLARQKGVDRNVVVKFLHSQHLGDALSRARFEREAKVIANLNHKNIVSCYAFGTTSENVPYLAFEKLEGTTLGARISTGSIPWEETFHIGAQICSALQQAHEVGIIHRDIKPDNIFLCTDGTAKLLDFGIACVTDQRITETGKLFGTAFYMSPEQAAGKSPIPASDVYSLACVLYECIGGKRALECDNPIGLLLKHLNEYPSMLREALPCLPKSVDDVLFKALQKDPLARYSSASDFAQDLHRAFAASSQKIGIDSDVIASVVAKSEARAKFSIPRLLIWAPYISLLTFVLFFLFLKASTPPPAFIDSSKWS